METNISGNGQYNTGCASLKTSRVDKRADDTQIDLAFKPSQQQSDLAINCLENCVSDIHVWMKQNFLKLNDNKK